MMVFHLQKQAPEVFYKKALLKNFAIFKENTSVGGSSNKVPVLQACNIIKNRFQNRCSPVNVANYLRTPILKNSCEPLLLLHLFL